MKILIVEDSKINQAIARDSLEKLDLDCEIVCANDGEEGLEEIAKGGVDLVLLDIVMPKMSGLEVLATLQHFDASIVPEIIMLTTISDPDTLIKCFEMGAVDYINKPFDYLEFSARIRSTLKSIRQKHQIRRDTLLLANQNKQLNEANRNLKEAQFYLIQKEKLVAIGELAAGVAHEINNPLAFVMSNFTNIKEYGEQIHEFLTWLRKSKSPLMTEEGVQKLEEKWEACDLAFILEDYSDLIEESQKGLDRMAKIVTSMRNFSRISDEDQYDYVDINELIEEVLLVVNNEIKYTAVIKKDYQSCPAVYCNKGEIEQVIVNLVMNASQAIKALEKTVMGTITISTICDTNHVIISICDDGCGMDEETLRKLFDPFFTTKPVGQGTGLGLSISHSIIVEKHLGKIDVKSELGIGSCFNVYLPIATGVL